MHSTSSRVCNILVARQAWMCPPCVAIFFSRWGTGMNRVYSTSYQEYGPVLFTHALLKLKQDSGGEASSRMTTNKVYSYYHVGQRLSERKHSCTTRNHGVCYESLYTTSTNIFGQYYDLPTAVAVHRFPKYQYIIIHIY